MRNLLIILGVLLVIVLVGGCSYNKMVTNRAEVDEKWAEVQSAYQRRADLIPNLVATVKGVANFEQSTLTQVIEARAKATSLNVNASDLTPDKLHQIQQSQSQLGSALGRLLVVSEQYPQLRATESFRALQDQLEGTENRIKVARDNYNVAVKAYDVYISSFPQNMISGMFGFTKRPWFEADEGAQKAPAVKF
ncbi:MAG TPA: LemA family protein [Flavipsychrobacter sp.]|nr:LemA family protein [Flavipsychrobacter sp.]